MTPLPIKFTLPGDVPSKKNRWRYGKHGVYTPGDIKVWVRACYFEMRRQLGPFGPVLESIHLEADFFVKRDKDLDNMLGSLMDLMQQAQLIKNDKLIVKITATKTKCSKQQLPYVDVRLHKILL